MVGDELRTGGSAAELTAGLRAGCDAAAEARHSVRRSVLWVPSPVPRGPVQRGVGEIGGHVAGPSPRFDGQAAVEQVKVRGHRAGVHGQAQGMVRAVRKQAGDAGVTGHAQRGRARLQLAGLGQRVLRVAATRPR